METHYPDVLFHFRFDPKEIFPHNYRNCFEELTAHSIDYL